MPRKLKVWEPEDLKKRAIGQAAHECWRELLGVKPGKRMTRVDRAALLDCIRRKIQEETRKKIEALKGAGAI
jgi:hypothetical protein